MTKPRIQDAFLKFILSATVALFCTVVLAPALTDARNSVPAIQPSSAPTLVADGTDPVPPQPPSPWQSAIA